MSKFFRAFIFLLLISIGFNATAANPRRTKATIKTTAECMFCKRAIETAIGKMDGVRKVSVDYVKHEVFVMFNSKKTSLDAIRKAMAEIGFDADDVKANQVKYTEIKHGGNK